MHKLFLIFMMIVFLPSMSLAQEQTDSKPDWQKKIEESNAEYLQKLEQMKQESAERLKRQNAELKKKLDKIANDSPKLMNFDNLGKDISKNVEKRLEKRRQEERAKAKTQNRWMRFLIYAAIGIASAVFFAIKDYLKKKKKKNDSPYS